MNPPSSTSWTRPLGVNLWIWLMGMLVVAGTVTALWPRGERASAETAAPAKEGPILTDEQMVEFEKSMEKLRVAAALTDVAERQQRLTEMMKRNQHEREAAKKDGRLPELIDELDRTDGETREVHRELSTSLALLQEMRGQGLDEDIDKVEKMHRWLGELLEMQKTIARSDRTSVEVEQDRR